METFLLFSSQEKSGIKFCFGLLVWKKNVSRLDLLTYMLFIIFYSRLI